VSKILWEQVWLGRASYVIIIFSSLTPMCPINLIIRKRHRLRVRPRSPLPPIFCYGQANFWHLPFVFASLYTSQRRSTSPKSLKIPLWESTISCVLLRVISRRRHQASQQLPWHLAHGHRRYLYNRVSLVETIRRRKVLVRSTFTLNAMRVRCILKLRLINEYRSSR